MSQKQDIYLIVQYDKIPDYQLEAAQEMYCRKRRKK
jgi:hypothetical protein